MKYFFTIISAILLTCSFSNARAQYTILTEFGDLETCDTMTKGPFIVWWDNSYPAPEFVSDFLDRIVEFRTQCLDDYNLQDPPAVEDGNYINYYFHESGDVFPDYFGNYVGGDTYGNAYVTIPKWLHWNFSNAAHETFHVFQYARTSPGYDYTDDGQWFTEASANWFKALNYPDEVSAFVTLEILAKLPQVPLWYGWNNRPEEHPENWQRENHQYALGYFLYYLTEVKGMPRTLITEGFYNGTDLIPQEYIANELGVSVFRSYFLDWTADVIKRFEAASLDQVEAAEDEWLTYAAPADDNQFIGTYTNTGTDGWVRPEEIKVTTGWSFNTYKISNDMAETYTFQINGDALSSEGDATHFEGLVVIKNDAGETTTYPLIMMTSQTGWISIDMASSDVEAYFIVASMPDVYEGVENYYSYEARISTGDVSELMAFEFGNLKASIYPNPSNGPTSFYIESPIDVDVNIRIVSIEGQSIVGYQLKPGIQLVEMDLSAFASGIYYVQFEVEGMVKTKKLIVQ
ncbi:MAG: hypothetical protein ACI8ZM_002542 [Crocinitomix sp.]|jgi:hypothetical protein